MPLSPDQDEALKKNLMSSFGAPAPVSMPPIGGSSFEVGTQGPNLDDTVKTVANAPVNVPAAKPEVLAPPAPEPQLPPMAPQQPPRSTPTGAPYTPPENPKIGDSHPGLGDDELKKYLEMQRGQIDKYGPDQEKAVMDRIKAQQGSFGHVAEGAMKKASDDIMQGVARAGSKDSFGQFQAKDQNDIKNAMAQNEMLHKDNMTDIGAKQGLDAMDSKSTLGKAMLNTWGPLLTKLGVPPDQQAKMIPSLISSMTPELTKHEDAMAKIQAAKMQRDGMMGYRQDQADQNQWVKLGDHVNSLNAGSRKALGIAASSNMRADRLLTTAMDPKATAQDITNMVADLQGIYKGGVPDEISLKHGQYNSLTQDLSRIQTYITANPASAKSPDVIQRLVKVAGELKTIDNKVINDNLGINAAIFRPIIEKDPQRWQDVISAVQGTTKGPQDMGKPAGSSQMPAAEGPYGASVVKDGKTYVWNAQTGKYHPE